MTSFPASGPVSARVEIEIGDVAISTGTADEITVDVSATDPASDRDRRAVESTRVTCADGQLQVIGPKNGALSRGKKYGSVQVAVSLPPASDVDVSASLGAIDASGDLGDLRGKTSAGDIRVQNAADADLKTGIGAIVARHISGEAHCSTGSGSIRVDRIGGRAVVKNSNGDTRIGDSGESLRVKSANGDIDVDRARGDVVATTANGSLRVGCAEQGSLQLKTSLGRIDIGIATGTAARLDLHTSFGNVHNGLQATGEPSSTERTLDIHAQTTAGDIDVVRAATDDE